MRSSASTLVVVVVALATACPAPSADRPKRDAAGVIAGNGEGEGEVVVSGEGEGEGSEGEGDGVGEGEGDAGEGEGEGDGVENGSAGCGIVVDTDPDGDRDPITYPLAVAVGPLQREFGVWAQENYNPNTAKSLVLIYHGNTNANQLPAGERGRGFFGMEGQVGEDALIVYVDAENLSQDPQFVSWETLDVSDDNPDIQAMQAIVAFMHANYCVDVTRTFAIGFSGGANFVSGVACQHAGLLRGIATYSGGFEERHGGALDLTTCDDTAVAALSIHNVNDGIADVEESDRAVDYFKAAAGCDDVTVATDDPDCEAFVGCAASTPVVQCRPSVPANPQQAHDVWKPQGPPFVWNFFQSL